jgi:alpha-amylase
MVTFRKLAAGTDVNHWWDDGANAIAFSRGNRGFVAISREAVTLDTTVTASLASGTYCDLLTGGVSGGTCAGATTIVDSAGGVRLHLVPNSAIAIDVATRITP